MGHYAGVKSGINPLTMVSEVG